MKTSSWTSMLIYLMSLGLFFNSNSLFVLLLIMEVNMVSFIWMVYSVMGDLNKQEMISSCFYYFLMQSLGSLMFLYSCLSSGLMLEVSDMIMVISISLKLALFPFFFWLYKISNFISLPMLVVLLSIQKIPLLFFSFSMGNYFLLILMSSGVMGCLYLVFSCDLVYLIVSSSIFSSFWIFFIFNLNFLSVFLFFCLYFSILMQLGYYMMSSSSFSFMSLRVIGSLILFLFLAGLPPFSLFFFKLVITYGILLGWSSLEFLIFWGASFLALFGYMKIFYQCFFSHVVHYLNNEKVFQKKSLFYFGMVNFVVFLVF